MLMMFDANPRVSSAFVATQIPSASDIDWSTAQTYDAIRDTISQCSLSYASLYRRYKHLTRTTIGVPAPENFDKLALQPINENRFSTDNHEFFHINFALNGTRMRSIPLARGGFGLFVLYFTPVIFDVVSKSSGQRTRHYEGIGAGPLNTAAAYEALPDTEKVQVMTGFGLGVQMANFYDLMQSITPSDPAAHTSLYDLSNGVMLASSALPRDAQTNGEVPYALGMAPLATINRALAVTNAPSQPLNTILVEFVGTDVILSAMHIAMPMSGSRYAVVQSTPHSFYFGELTHVRTVMIIIGVVCCAFVIALCLGVAAGIFRGIGQLLDNMALAAQMKNDRTTFIKTFISDIDRLAKGFGNMNNKLLEARAYLPQHLLVTSDDSALEDEEGSMHADDLRAGATPRSLAMSTSLQR